MRILWDERAWEEYLSWQTEDKKTLKRINALIKDIQRNPFDGIGKPEPLMVQYAMASTGFSPAETLMIGDRLYTDIAAGNRAGVDSLCVLSGEATLQDVRESPDQPTYLLTDVGVLAEIIAEN
jgi:ribonucleotide monophosphatase NagD (HAD superfamily)